MASPFSHAVAALSVGTCFYRSQIPKSVWVAGTLCSVFPDLDVIGFRFGIRYDDFWGHRGFTHSLPFAALLAGIVAIVIIRAGVSGIGRFALFGYLFLATASHGVLDAITNGDLHFLRTVPVVGHTAAVHRSRLCFSTILKPDSRPRRAGWVEDCEVFKIVGHKPGHFHDL